MAHLALIWGGDSGVELLCHGPTERRRRKKRNCRCDPLNHYTEEQEKDHRARCRTLILMPILSYPCAPIDLERRMKANALAKHTNPSKKPPSASRAKRLAHVRIFLRSSHHGARR